MKKFLHQRKNSFLVAWAGLVLFFRSEIHAFIHLLAIVVVILMGWLFSVTPHDWIALLLSIALVVQAEIWNTLFEKVADFIHPEYEPRIKVIKDLAASAVLWCAMCAVIIALVVFLPYFFEWLKA